MKHLKRGRGIWLAGAAAIGLSTSAGSVARAEVLPASHQLGIERGAALEMFASHHEGVLGTSMELIVEAPRFGQAAECARRVDAEIERLRRILSTYDPASEIRRVMAGDDVESAELAEVLDAYGLWGERSGGAIEVNLGGVVELWKEAEGRGRCPDVQALRAALARARAWNVDALGKGYVIDRAVAVGREIAPGGLLNIGGDIRTWGLRAWPIAIADPVNPAENAVPLARFELRDAAVATSGNYARFRMIGGRRFGHLIDPRTLQPCDLVESATVVAGDCVTANALSSAACVLGANEGARLAGAYGLGFWFWPGAAGGGAVKEAAAGATAWPDGFQVSLNLSLKMAVGRKVKRPYVAVWVEDANGKVVRTVTMWGKQEKYWREMTAWWQAIRGDVKLARSVTRATREAGKYTISWDGKDDAGKALPRGAYTLVVEINREHGRHVGEKIKLNCQDKKGSTVMKATAESDESPVEYGPAAK